MLCEWQGQPGLVSLCTKVGPGRPALAWGGVGLIHTALHRGAREGARPARRLLSKLHRRYRRQHTQTLLAETGGKETPTTKPGETPSAARPLAQGHTAVGRGSQAPSSQPPHPGLLPSNSPSDQRRKRHGPRCSWPPRAVVLGPAWICITQVACDKHSCLDTSSWSWRVQGGALALGNQYSQWHPGPGPCRLVGRLPVFVQPIVT